MNRQIVFLTILVTLLPSLALKNITITKCCPNDQKLTVTSDQKTCEAGLEKAWFPKIYSPVKRTYINVPKSWIIKNNNQFLECDGNIKVYKQGAPTITYVLLSNGNLTIFELPDANIPPSRYCIDSGYALVCEETPENLHHSQELAQPKTRIKKCCGKGAVWSELKNSCVVMSGNDYKIELEDDKVLVDGFPGCSDYVLVGKLHEGKMRADGSLELDGGKTVFPVDGYCLEHVLENAGKIYFVYL